MADDQRTLGRGRQLAFRIAGRTKWYATIEEIQTDLDDFLQRYDFHRTHRVIEV